MDISCTNCCWSIPSVQFGPPKYYEETQSESWNGEQYVIHCIISIYWFMLTLVSNQPPSSLVTPVINGTVRNSCFWMSSLIGFSRKCPSMVIGYCKVGSCRGVKNARQQKHCNEKTWIKNYLHFKFWFSLYLTFANVTIVSASTFFKQSAISFVLSMLQPDRFANIWWQF